MGANFVPGRTYIARNSRLEDCGKWLCVKRTDSFVTFQKGAKLVRRKPLPTSFGERVVIIEGRHWKGVIVGEHVLRAEEYI